MSTKPLYLVLVSHPDNADACVTAYRGTDRALADSICGHKRGEGRTAIVVEVLRDYKVGDYIEVMLSPNAAWLSAQVLAVDSVTGLPTLVHTTQGGVRWGAWHMVRRAGS